MWKCPRGCHEIPAFRVTKILKIFREEKFYYKTHDKSLEYAESIELLSEGDPDWSAHTLCSLCGAVVKWEEFKLKRETRSHSAYTITWENEAGRAVTSSVTVESHPSDILVEYADAMTALRLLDTSVKQQLKRVLNITHVEYFDMKEEE